MNRLVIGAPDKTGYLLSLMAWDFADGYVLLDTTGHVAEAAANALPVHLTEQVCYLDAADIEHPFGFNVLNGVRPDDRYRVAKDICAVFDVVFPEGPSTLTRRRSSTLLLNALLVIMEAPRPNFLSVPRFLSDNTYRTELLRQCTNPVVLEFWKKDFLDWRDDDTLPLKAKCNELFASPLVRNILGQQHSTFSLEPGRVVLVNLSRARLGDATAFLLACLILSRTQGYVYLTDTGFLGSDALASALQEERFTIVCRYLDELPTKLRQAALSIGEKIVFRSTKEDAERLAPYLQLIALQELTDMQADHLYTRDGVFLVPAIPAGCRLRAVKRRSRTSFTRPRRKVESELLRYLHACTPRLSSRLNGAGISRGE